jgi:hypothetical protein
VSARALALPSARLRALHLLGLSAFAIAQPGFQQFAKTPEYFVVRGYRALDVVLYALVLALLVPAVFFGVEVLAGLVHERVLSIVHQAFVVILTFVILGNVLFRRPPYLPIGVVVVLVIVCATAYQFLTPVRSLATMAAFAPLLFVPWFLFNAHLRSLDPSRPAGVAMPVVHSQTPVVLLVFDEFALSSLLTRDGHIDAARYPNFAALARSSTWYRNATTVYDVTDLAVPAILTGRLRRHDELPSVADYPRNLFTLLGRSYRINAFEAEARLCPTDLCPTAFPSARERLIRLASDITTVSRGQKPLWEGDWDKPADEVGHFLGNVRPTRRPALHFMHVLLPHIPYQYLPSGRTYEDGRALPGYGAGFSWGKDPWFVDHNYERFLLQLAYTDHVLGQGVKRLQATGLWKRSLVIVTADHGVSFRPGGHRRYVDLRNIGDIAPIPLFVKLPGQERGRVDNLRARSIDIVPTIADVLRIKEPWKLDGKSLLAPDRAPPQRTTVWSHTGNVATAPWRKIEAQQRQTLEWKLRLFGSGNDSVFAEGNDRLLLGRSVSSFPTLQNAALRVLFGERTRVSFDPRSSSAPARVGGRVIGTGGKRLKLAITVNGRIAAVTDTLDAGGTSDFSTFVPDYAFHRGQNTIDVFAVRTRQDGKLALARLGSTDKSLSLASSR